MATVMELKFGFSVAVTFVGELLTKFRVPRFE